VNDSLWIELAPGSGKPATRLIVVLHDQGHSAQVMLPIAVVWQLKFPGACIAIIDAPMVIAGTARAWINPLLPRTEQRELANPAIAHLAQCIQTLQRQTNTPDSQTIVIGFGQGADIAIEFMRRNPEQAPVVVSYAGRLLRPTLASEALNNTVHLFHGALDTQVLLDYAHQTQRHLSAIGCEVTLDVVDDLGHDIDQDLINLSTWRTMRTIFKGRERRPENFRLH
jgi:phospholipase/carboxylesterase